MSKEEDNEDTLKLKHDELCAQLNVDTEAKMRSWKSYSAICQNYTLDGEPLHWLSCALYVACRNTIIPTVRPGTAVEGNCVSLTKLLRLCNISLIQFFNKIKKWMEMASMSDEFCSRIERLQRKFTVSTVLFQKFQPIFNDLFHPLNSESTKTNHKGNKKQKLTPCTCKMLFEFCWCLFVCVKGEYHGSADDLVDMYHVLLCCLDFIYANAFMALRRDLINPTFPGLSPQWKTDTFKLPDEPPCIMNTLCTMRQGLVIEATALKQYSWKPILFSFFSKGILRGDPDTMMGVLDIGNFEANLKSLNNLYETYVLSVGEFDERIFLGDHANAEVGSPSKVSNDEISKAMASFGSSGWSVGPATPLTGRHYLRPREPLTPVSAATQSVGRLHAYLAGCKPEPHVALFKEYGVDETLIQTCIVGPCERWSNQFSKAYAVIAGNEIASARCTLVTKLHYNILEHILREEKRKKPQLTLQSLVSQEIFQMTLFACCAEIVLHAYGAHSVRFPWILKCFGLHAFDFYKIIEIVVLAIKERLSRDIVKHLNVVEEQALESLVWAGESPLWERMWSAGGVPPACHVYTRNDTPSSPPPLSQLPQRRQNVSSVLQSPVSSAAERFLSPISEMAKKQLFKDTKIKPGQSLLAQNAVQQENISTGGNDAQNQNRLEANEVKTEDVKGANKELKKTPKSSLGIFFRKFYSLAVVRIQDLCQRLRLTDSDLEKKIWTCLEYSIMHQTHLMRDRHLDQILMCAVYVICKVSNNSTNKVERTFTEIMRCYRQQPQADNHVYRYVLIGPLNEDAPDNKAAEGKESSSTERGDLIKFYNKVYVQCMQSFALRFTGRQQSECPLSPLPSPRGGNVISPLGGQRVSERHRLFVKPLGTATPPQDPLTYRFSRSPAKDLQEINSMLSRDVGLRGVKRNAFAEPGGAMKRTTYNPAPGVSRKLHGLITDRQAV